MSGLSIKKSCQQMVCDAQCKGIRVHTFSESGKCVHSENQTCSIVKNIIIYDQCIPVH